MPPVRIASLVAVALCAPSFAAAVERAAARAPDARAREFVQARTGSLQRCYEDVLRERPTARGKVRVRLTVARDGAVRDVTVVLNELGPAMAECVRAAVQAWKAPFRPEEPVVVEAPFSFTPVE
ncbi:MAG TPA: AgmX/PglI C-terminal domain-containing protein [Anaeromyxobacter sp.]|nr:AgmX/PglI C-terminal domain-containing protein [Anaeromyxobacter sp.]